MIEAEWLASDDTMEMYQLVGSHATSPFGPRVSRRVASLFGVACVRATPRAAEQPLLQKAVEVVERVAAVTGNWDEVDRANRRLYAGCEKVTLNSIPHFWLLAGYRLTQDIIDQYAMHVPFFLVRAMGRSRTVPKLRRVYADCLRDIAGNPFRGRRGCQFDKRKRKPQPEPIFRPEWRTSTVEALARGMYEARDFGAMPILADALQDAGCDSDDILDHCRDPHATPVRGCWVVDLVLGKE
jgi:hypothetical protein